MIWNPIISAVIFLTILIPTVWIGFKKGWKSALLISLLLIIFNFIILGIGIIIYDKVWSLYRKVFLGGKYKVNFDINVLSDVYKPRVLLLFNLLLIPFSSFFTWLIHLATKKALTKHWQPKSQRLSKSNKRILISSNSKRSKIIGGILLASSSIFLSSYVVSGVNVITTPLNNKNLFTKATDWLGKIYSIGLASNSDVPFYVDDFIKNADEQVVDGLTSLLTFTNMNSKESIDKELNNVNVIKTKNSIFKNLFKSPEASYKILESILMDKDTFINPLLWDKTVYQKAPDKYGNPQGYGDLILDNGKKRIMFINELKNYLLSNHFNYSVPDEVKNVYINLFKEFLNRWDKTKFFTYLETLKGYIKENENNLNYTKEKFEDTKNEKALIIKNRNRNKYEIEKLMSLSWINTNLIFNNSTTYNNVNDKNVSEWKEFCWTKGFDLPKSYFMPTNPEIKDTKIYKQYLALENYKADATNKRKIVIQAEQNRKFKENNFLILNNNNYNFNSAKSHLNKLKSSKESNIRFLKYWDDNLNVRRSRVFQIDNDVPKINNKINNIKQEKNSLQNQQSIAESELKKLNNKLGSAEYQYNVSLRKFTNIKNKFSTDQQSYYNSVNDLKELQKNLLNKENNLKNSKKNLNDRQNMLNKINNLKIEIQDKKNEAINKKNDTINKKNQMKQSENSKKDFQKDFNNNYSNFNNIKNEVSNKKDTIRNLSMDISNMDYRIDQFNSNLKDFIKEKTKLINSLRDSGLIKEAETNVKYFKNEVKYSTDKFNNFNDNYYKDNYDNYEKLLNIENKKDKIANNAEKKRDDQKLNIDNMIKSVIAKIKQMEDFNKRIKYKSELLAKYDNNKIKQIINKLNIINKKDYQLLFDRNNTKSNYLDGPNGLAYDEVESIDYFKSKLKSSQERKKACQEIASSMKNKFNYLKERLLKIYKSWIYN